jgi:hypothetical protein
MPSINFNVEFKDVKGAVVLEPVVDNENFEVDEKGQRISIAKIDDSGKPIMKPVVVRDLVANLLLANYQGDESLPFTDRAKRGYIAQKVINNEAVNYTTEELSLIQSLAAKSRSTLVLFQLDKIINGEG